MRLKRLEIRNYKSLRDVVIEPTPLAVLVGPNAAGKSNFADALDFLGEVYRWQLEGAVAKKGGYENICFRQVKRSTAAIRFRVVVETVETSEDNRKPPSSMGNEELPREFIFDHTFELRAKSRGIRSPFHVVLEALTVFSRHPGSASQTVDPIIQFCRGHRDFRWESSESSLLHLLHKTLKNALQEGLFDSALLVNTVSRFISSGAFLQDMGSVHLFQLSPLSCRQTGVPTPNPVLDRYGGNLPAVIDYLKREHPQQYEQLLESAREVMPSLEELETGFTPTKTLGLYLKEAGVKRPWTVEDISAGTLQTIALLAATFDPRIRILVIEEPENSVHPWALRNLVQAFRLASERKQVILTTHSPVLIDQVRPEELWVVQRPGTETRIDPVLALDPLLKEGWGQGRFTLSEYLDSGALPQAVPAAGA